MPYAEGDVIRARGNPNVFVVEDGKRRWIPDAPTLLSKWKMDQIHTLPDEEVNPIPVGAPLRSVMQVTTYPDGTLLQGDGPAVYVIDQGQRRWIPDHPTFEARGFVWTNIMRISEPELQSIPEGPALAPVRRIEANVDTFLGAGHYMSTDVYMTRDGHLKGITRTRTITWFGGYTGGVQVVMANGSGAAVACTSMHSFGVNGTAFGGSDRTDSWTENVDPGIVQQTASLSIVHVWTPKVTSEQIVNEKPPGWFTPVRRSILSRR